MKKIIFFMVFMPQILQAAEEKFSYPSAVINYFCSAQKHRNAKSLNMTSHRKVVAYKPHGHLKKKFRTGSSLEFSVSIGGSGIWREPSEAYHTTGSLKVKVVKEFEEVFPRFSPVTLEYFDSLYFFDQKEVCSSRKVEDLCYKNFPSKIRRVNNFLKKSPAFIASILTPQSNYLSESEKKYLDIQVYPSQPLDMDESPDLDVGFDLDEVLKN